jgi:hypothetical protein
MLRVGMDLESIMLCLAMKHLRAVEIHGQVNNVLGGNRREPEIGSPGPMNRAVYASPS